MERKRIRCSKCLGYCEDVRPVLNDGVSARCVKCGKPIYFRDVLIWELAVLTVDDRVAIVQDAVALREEIHPDGQDFWLKVAWDDVDDE